MLLNLFLMCIGALLLWAASKYEGKSFTLVTLLFVSGVFIFLYSLKGSIDYLILFWSLIII